MLVRIHPDDTLFEVMARIAAARIGFYIARAPVMMEGRIELLQYYRQQSICNNYHRYGNLGERGLADNIREVNTTGPSMDRSLLRFPVQQG